MTAQNDDIEIEQGSVFDETVIYYDVDGSIFNLTGYTAALQVRKYKDSSSTLISLTSGSGLTITGAAGQIDILINATDTAALDFIGAYYDLEITPASGAADTIRLMQGSVKLDKEVTR